MAERIASVKLCEFCGEDEAPSICSGCGVVEYCNAVCQRKHWKTHKNLCVVVSKRRTTAVAVQLDTWPKEYSSERADGIPPLYPGRPAWIDDVLAFIARCRYAFPAKLRRLPMTGEKSCEWYIDQVAGQVALDERSELPNLWREVYGPDARVSCAEHLTLHRLSGFVMVMGDKVIALRKPKPGAVDTTDLMTRAEFEEQFLPIMRPLKSLRWSLPPLCENASCKLPAACRCICNAAYCSRECQVAAWESHQRAHEEVKKLNPDLFELTQIYWADRLRMPAMPVESS